MKTFKEYRFENNPDEKLIVDKFIDLHGNEMDNIVFGGFNKNDILSEREKNIVLSTIQWMESPIGKQFLKDFKSNTK